MSSLHKKVYQELCYSCCEEVLTLKKITIAFDKNDKDATDGKGWHIDIQLRTKTKLIKWMLKRGRTVDLTDFL